MLNISDIFTSKARVRVLKTLAFHAEALPLRHIAAVSDLPVFSVQNAARSLTADGILLRTEKENNVLFELSRSCEIYDLLSQLFFLEARYRISKDAEKNSRKAARALAFANSAGIILRRAKRKGLKWT